MVDIIYININTIRKLINSLKTNRFFLFNPFVFFMLLTPASHAVQIPDWMLNTPNDSSTWFYSVGNGDNRTNAQKSAIANLSGRIQISVQTSTQQFVGSHNQNVDYYLELDNKFESDLQRFYNTEIIREHQHNNHIYVLIRVDKNSFFNAKHKHILQTLQNVNPESVTITSQIAKFLAYHWQRSAINNEITLLNAYNRDTTELNQLQTKIELINNRLAKSINLSVHLPAEVDSTSTTINQQLLQWLTDTGLTVDNKNSHNHLTVTATALNHWTGKDKFNHVSKLAFELAFIFNDQLIERKNFSAQAFDSTPEVSKQKALSKLKNLLQSN